MLCSPTQSSPISTTLPAFRNGDEVTLAKGLYQGTLGVFLNFKGDDPKWADVLERNGEVRSHPVEWLEYIPS
jgi:hypothetical protein